MMSPDELKVLGQITGRTSANPIKDREIAQATGLDQRVVSDIIKRLVEVHQIPIGAAKEAPYGRYVIHSKTELDRYLASLTAMETSLRHRITAIQEAFEYYRGNPVQLNLGVG